MTEIYEDIDKLVLQFVKDGTDKGLITIQEVINGCRRTGWMPKQVKESISKQISVNVIAKKSDSNQLFVVRKNA